MRDSVPSASYSSVCNVLRQWNISLIPTYRVYRLYDTYNITCNLHDLDVLKQWEGHPTIAIYVCAGMYIIMNVLYTTRYSDRRVFQYDAQSTITTAPSHHATHSLT